MMMMIRMRMRIISIGCLILLAMIALHIKQVTLYDDLPVKGAKELTGAASPEVPKGRGGGGGATGILSVKKQICRIKKRSILSYSRTNPQSHLTP